MATWSSAFSDVELPVHPGTNTFRIGFQQLRLLPGRYFLAFSLHSNRGYEDTIHEAVPFEIIPTAEIDPNKMDGSVLTSATVSILD